MIKEVQPKISPGDLSEKMNLIDVCNMSGEFDKNFDFYIPNRDVPAIEHPTDPMDDNHPVIKISDKMISSDIVAFKKFFEKDLKMLEEAYGSYEINWGFLHWYS